MIKICFCITNLETGGAEAVLLNLLKRIDRTRFSPTVISLVGMGRIGPQIESLGISVYALGMSRNRPSFLKAFQLINIFRKLKPDIVHTWMYHSDLIGGMAAKLTGCKNIIWGIHHSNLSKTENKGSTLLVVKACAWLSKIIPNQVISCSKRAEEVHVLSGYVKEKFNVIPNGFDLDRFTPNAAARVQIREELALSHDTLLVGVIARFHPQKNHLGFIKAAARILEKKPGTHFLLAGADIDNSNVQLVAAIKYYGLEGHTHLLGRRDDVPHLMAALDVLASPSLGEAFPNVLGEAMACGVPCVVTDVGDCAEIVGQTGINVPASDMALLAEKIVDLLHLPEKLRVNLGLDARARVAANYEIGEVTKLYEAAYNRI